MINRNVLNIGNSGEKGSGVIELAVNGDENRIIRFNPDDITFANRFYDFISEFQIKKEEFSKKLDSISPDDETVTLANCKNTKEILDATLEICMYLRSKIDYVFGEGTSQTAFGDTNSFSMFIDFLEGITPYIRKVRSQRIKKYTGKYNNKKR